jgi:hypothetical protein
MKTMKGKEGFQRGQSGNPKGRPKGAISKLSKDLRLQISDFLEQNFEKVVKEFNRMSGKDKLKFYTDLLAFALPRLQSIEMHDLESLTEAQIDQILMRLRRDYEQAKQEYEQASKN